MRLRGRGVVAEGRVVGEATRLRSRGVVAEGMVVGSGLVNCTEGCC